MIILDLRGMRSPFDPSEAVPAEHVFLLISWNLNLVIHYIPLIKPIKRLYFTVVFSGILKL
jgi:hypothetical protein